MSGSVHFPCGCYVSSDHGPDPVTLSVHICTKHLVDPEILEKHRELGQLVCKKALETAKERQDASS